jgi:hypothetical protein
MSDDSLLPIKVIIERKKSISETIPEDVTREKMSRWLDVISPVTAWCGLIGDQLEHKRSLLRLEREAALYELAEKLKPKLEGKVITPIPSKQLIPALEKASLEQPGSEFIEKWANLLASAATDPGDDTQTCTSILAELGHNEAELLDTIQKKLIASQLWPNNLEKRYVKTLEFVKQIYRDAQSIMLEVADDQEIDSERLRRLSSLVEPAPLLVVNVTLSKSESLVKSLGILFSDDQKIAIDILEYRNLIKRESYRSFDLGSPGVLSISWFNLTNLGLRFLMRVSSTQA